MLNKPEAAVQAALPWWSSSL